MSDVVKEKETEQEIKEEVEPKTQEEKKFEKVQQNEKIIEEMNPNKKRSWLYIVIFISIVSILVIFISTVFSLTNMNNEKIVRGVTIGNTEVSGMSKQEAIEKLNNIYQEKKDKEIGIRYEEYETTLNNEILEVNYDIDKAVEEAYNIGKQDNIFVNNYEILFALLGKKNINVDMILNEEIAKQNIEDINTNLPGTLIESTYSIEENELVISKGKEGIVVDTNKLLENIKENLNNVNTSDDYIEIPVTNKEPETINIEKIHTEICQEPKDAYFEKEPFAIYPEVIGISFDIEQAREILKEEEKEEYIIPLNIIAPKVTISQIGAEAFSYKIVTFTTRYDPTAYDRTTNLRIASDKINEKIVMPGETFSYNKALGARTSAAGYKNAKVFENGEVVDGIGGGICQVSSTLYNAVLMADLEIVERRNHQFVTSYLPAGRDATVVYGAIDFKFKNTRKYPVRIVSSVQNGISAVSIYGIKEENEYTFSFSTRTVATIPFSIQYEEDASLTVGTENIKQKGANGLKTETYITKMLNGKVISTNLLSKDTYSAMKQITIKGTKPEIQNPIAPVQPPVETPVPPIQEVPSEETPVTP